MIIIITEIEIEICVLISKFLLISIDSLNYVWFSKFDGKNKGEEKRSKNNNNFSIYIILWRKIKNIFKVYKLFLYVFLISLNLFFILYNN